MKEIIHQLYLDADLGSFDSWQSFCGKQFCLFCLFLSVFGKMSDCQILPAFCLVLHGKVKV